MNRIGEALLALERREIGLDGVVSAAMEVVREQPANYQAVVVEVTTAYNSGQLSANDFAELMKALADGRTSVATVYDVELRSVQAAEAATVVETAADLRTVVAGGGSASVVEPTDAELATRIAVSPPLAEAKPKAQAPKKLGPGSVLNKQYQLEQQIGEGGMGVVYRAKDLLADSLNDRDPFVVLKVLSASFKVHPDSLTAMQREASRAMKLRHENIVHVQGFHHDEDGDHYYIVMEYLRGRGLDKVLASAKAQRGLVMKEAWSIIEGTGRALEHAHEKGLIHSDVKPSNVWVTEDGTVKLLDFGIARAADPDTLTKFKGIAALSVGYAPPEVHRQEEADRRDDVYGLACVAYKVITGQHPFPDHTAVEAEDAQLTPERPEGLKARQWHALERGLHFERAKRTPSIGEFLDELDPSPPIKPAALAAIVASVSMLLLLSLGSVGYYFGWIGTSAMDADDTYIQRLLEEPPYTSTLSREEVDTLLREGADYTAWGREDLETGEYQRGNAQLKNGASTAFRPLFEVLQGTQDAGKRLAAANGIRRIDLAYVATVRDLIQANMPQKALWLTCQGLQKPPGAGNVPRWHELVSLYQDLWRVVYGEEKQSVSIDKGCSPANVPHSWGAPSHTRSPSR